MESGPRYVRLESGKPNRKGEKKAAQPSEPTVKLAIRLNEGVNDALRTLIRYRGDLSAMAIEAINGVELESAS